MISSLVHHGTIGCVSNGIARVDSGEREREGGRGRGEGGRGREEGGREGERNGGKKTIGKEERILQEPLSGRERTIQIHVGPFCVSFFLVRSCMKMKPSLNENSLL